VRELSDVSPARARKSSKTSMLFRKVLPKLPPKIFGNFS
jgi:hypothetical protein